MRLWPGVAVVLALAACGGNTPHAVRLPPSILISSPRLQPARPIPREFTCDGSDLSPPLRWSHPPRRAERLALVMLDLDAHNFVHWSLSAVPPRTDEIATGQSPSGAVKGRNGFGSFGYRGPCPPPGTMHRYIIELRALAGGKVVGFGSLLVTYARR